MRLKFQLGQGFITPAALNALDMDDVYRCLVQRHGTGDWGDLCDEDKALNDESLKSGGRLFSQYHDRNNVKFWIITEADRSVTTVLLPDDY